jgi:glycosyltransferase involved in cell wall biosynthesis
MPRLFRPLQRAGAGALSPNPPSLSVALPAFNSELFIAETIESVLGQDFGDFEFLVLNDGSTDRTLEIAASYAARDSRIRVISRENRGLPASLDELLRAARAPIIARIDADDVCEPSRFSKQLVFLETHADYGIVGSQVHEIDSQGRRVPGSRVPCTHEEILTALPRYCPFYHPAVMMRRDLVIAVGGYRALFRYAEDYDLWLRLSEVTRMANLPDALLTYRLHPEQSTRRNMIGHARYAAVAWLAHAERAAGRPDPTEQLATFPRDEDVEVLFGAGALAYLRRRVFNDVLSSRAVRIGDAWPTALECASGIRDHLKLVWIGLRHVRADRPGMALKIFVALLRRLTSLVRLRPT